MKKLIKKSVKYCVACKKELEKNEGVPDYIVLQCREKDKYINELLLKIESLENAAENGEEFL